MRLTVWLLGLTSDRPRHRARVNALAKQAADGRRITAAFSNAAALAPARRGSDADDWVRNQLRHPRGGCCRRSPGCGPVGCEWTVYRTLIAGPPYIQTSCGCCTDRRHVSRGTAARGRAACRRIHALRANDATYCAKPDDE